MITSIILYASTDYYHYDYTTTTTALFNDHYEHYITVPIITTTTTPPLLLHYSTTIMSVISQYQVIVSLRITSCCSGWRLCNNLQAISFWLFLRYRAFRWGGRNFSVLALTISATTTETQWNRTLQRHWEQRITLTRFWCHKIVTIKQTICNTQTGVPPRPATVQRCSHLTLS